MAESKIIYRLLLKLYPARFREEYSGPLERQFLDDYRDAQGPGARALLWTRALGDLAISIPAQVFREMAQDLRYAFRVYRKRSFVTALALVALALAIGASTGVFSVLNALLLRGLPFKEPERLVQIEGLRDWTTKNAFLSDATDFSPLDMTVGRTADGVAGDAVHANVAQTSANFFEVLGTDARLGRTFAAGEDVPGRDALAVISYGLWQQMFGGDARALGQTVRLNGVPLTVIGITPPAFEYPARTALWTTLRNMPVGPGVIGGASIARLRPGVTVTQARAVFLEEMRRENPAMQFLYTFAPLRDQLAGPVRQASMVLLALVGFVLLIACANVAQLLLSRTTDRRQELAMREALGASRARLIQQLITEALLLTVAAAAAGLVVARWASSLAMSVQPSGQLASQSYTILDGRVLGFAAGVAILTGLIFGVMPARLLGQVSGQARTTGVTRIRTGLVMLQAALTVVLLAGSVTLGRSFLKLLGTDMGFHTDHVATFNVSLVGTAYDEDQRRYYNHALDHLRAVPGVEAAGAVKYLPLIQNEYPAGGYFLEGERLATHGVISNNSAPGYFRAMGTEIVAGRDFTATDVNGSMPVAIVDEDFARPLGTRMVGRKVMLDFGRGNTWTYTVVGVVRTIHMNHSIVHGGLRAQIYFPFEQPRGGVGGPGYMTFVARVHGDAAEYLPVLRDAMQQVDGSIPVYDVKTLDQRLGDALARPRFYTTAILFLAGFALLLAIIGIYGVASYSVAQRTKEIGVRLAVGASTGVVRGMLLREGLWPLGVGMTAGAFGAIGLGRFLQSLMDSADPVSTWTCAAAAILLVFAGAVAVWRATARVVRVDPMRALRTD